MAIKKKSRKRGNVVSVDFTGVEAGGRPCPDGTFKCEVQSISQEESSTGNPMLVAKFKVLQGKGKGAIIYDNLSLQPQALFRLKALCEALGIEADAATDLDLDEFVGQEVVIDVENETYEDKKRPRAAGYSSPDSASEKEEDSDEDESEDDDEDSSDDEEGEDEEGEEDEEEDEKPRKKSGKTVKRGKKEEDEDEDDEDDEDEEDEDSDDDDAEEDEEDDEEEEDRPTKKPAGKAGKSGSKTSTGLVKGAKVKFKDGKTLIKGTVLSVKNNTCRVEDKNGDEYDVPSKQVELI